jgi:magnesium-transporting ATPase (P-type)
VDLFVKMCELFNVVVCARCAPVQKAEVVSLVTKRLHKISLAIGDGGNDVPMIQSADVGVGIMGNEGMQASRSSDFSIGEFRLLKCLLAVHERYSSLRMADLIKFSFYKKVAFCTPQVIFAIYSLYSANTIHNEWIILAYNIAFTGPQPLVNAIFDKDLSEDVLELFPEAYCTAERKHPLTPRCHTHHTESVLHVWPPPVRV